jgi:hypothetical protein
MGQIRFKHLRPYRASAVMTARAAVLSEMAYPVTDDASLYKACDLLQIRWRHAATELAAHGWHPWAGVAIEDEEMRLKQLERLLNCRPMFTDVLPRTHYCYRTLVCPHCYARRVAGLYSAMMHRLHVRETEVTELDLSSDVADELAGGREQRQIAIDMGGEQLTVPYTLVERRHEFNRPILDLPHLQALSNRKVPIVGETELYGRRYERRESAQVAQIAGRLRQRLDGLGEARRRVTLAAAPLGAICYTTVEPWEGCWHFEQRQLYIFAAHTGLPESVRQQTTGRIRTYATVNAKTIALALRRTFAYTPRLLIGDHSLTAIYLNACRGRRMWTTTGIMRGTSNEDFEE